METALRLFSLCLLLLAGPATALSIPDRPAGHVNDYAGILKEGEKLRLESDLRAFAQSQSTQIVVAIFPSLDGGSLEDVSIRLAERWQIGQKGKDNGVILLIFPNDRKMRIEVGYGLEDRLTDAVSSSILRNEIAPRFKSGDYGQGVAAGVQAIQDAIRGAYAAEPRRGGENRYGSALSILFFLIFFFFISALKQNRGFRRYTHSGLSRSVWWGGGGSGRSFGGGGFGGFSGGGGRFGGGGSSGGW